MVHVIPICSGASSLLVHWNSCLNFVWHDTPYQVCTSKYTQHTWTYLNILYQPVWKYIIKQLIRIGLIYPQICHWTALFSLLYRTIKGTNPHTFCSSRYYTDATTPGRQCMSGIIIHLNYVHRARVGRNYTQVHHRPIKTQSTRSINADCIITESAL